MAANGSQRHLMFAGGALTLAGMFGYDIATYFFLPHILIVLSGVMLVAGLGALLIGVLRLAWRASANTLATIGLVLGLGFVMATVSPTVFAPPTLQGGETELFHRTPLILAFAGALLLVAAGCRYMADRLHHRSDGRPHSRQ